MSLKQAYLNLYSWLCSHKSKQMFWTMVNMISYFQQLFKVNYIQPQWRHFRKNRKLHRTIEQAIKYCNGLNS